MHENDVTDNKEDNINNDSNNKSSIPTESTVTQTHTHTETEAKVETETEIEIVSIKATTTTEHSAIYPIISVVDEVEENVITGSNSNSGLPQKRKRQRRAYVAAPARCASLRSSRNPTSSTPVTTTTATTAATATAITTSDNITPLVVPILPPILEIETFNYLKREHFKPELWNEIREVSDPESPVRKSQRKNSRHSNRKRNNSSSNNNTNNNRLQKYSPETAAAIAAAQFELDSGKPTTTTTRKTKTVRALRKRNNNNTNSNTNNNTATNSSNSNSKSNSTTEMSLYDRRYQTADERRMGNGYGSSSSGGVNVGGMRMASGISDIDVGQDQYYGPNGGNGGGGGGGGAGGGGGSNSNATGSGSGLTSGLNGSASTLNHAPSMGTLCNIGNSCYLNSVIYTLRFAPHFVHNLHHLINDLNVVQAAILRQHNVKSASLGRGGISTTTMQLEQARSWSSKDLATNDQYIGNGNGNGSGNGNGNGNGSVSSCSSASSKSSHQSVSEKLHELYHSLHSNEMADSTESHHADTLLHAIQDVNATFEGNQQQDAHEFLMCVLNCIRETNQSLIKAIGDCPDVIANGYIANPDETDNGGVLGLERSETAGPTATTNVGNGILPASQTTTAGAAAAAATTTTTSTKSSFFSRKSKRKDEVKASKATRLQSPLKDGSIATTLGGHQSAQPSSNSLFYLNTVDLTGTSGSSSAMVPAAVAAAGASGATAKYASDDEMAGIGMAIATTGSLKDKMKLDERIRKLNLDFFSADFEGIVVLTTKCLSCETITRQKQGMLDISVPVPISGYDNADYSDKPSAYIQNSCITREYFRGENKYSCNQCTGYTEAIRSISYEVLPRLLVIQLNRFSGGMEKVSTYVPTTFTLQCFCAKCCELSEGNKLHVYKLYSVITHVGATLTVGHYIAYTCFLDLASDYINCPKDRRTSTQYQQQQQQHHHHHHQQQHQQNQQQTGTGNENVGSSNGVSSAAAVLASSGTSLMKRIKFVRSKASSSGDMSKNVKQLNGITSKTITNGINKLSMNTTCNGVNCCAMRLCCSQQQQQQASHNNDISEESMQNGTNINLSHNNSSSMNSGSSSSNNTGGGGSSSTTTTTTTTYPTGYGSTGRGGIKSTYAQSTATSTTEPIWYMCDDDKIKAMTQREFEDLLSPTRKITITPYLLFYARFDLQPTSSQQQQATAGGPTSSSSSTTTTATTTTSPPPPPQQQQQQQSSSWSNDNLHKM